MSSIFFHCSNDSTFVGFDETEHDNIVQFVQTVDENSSQAQSIGHHVGRVPSLTVAAFEDVPSRWSLFVTSFLSSPDVISAVDSLPYFPLVLKASCCWIQSLTRDCCEQFEPHLNAINEKYSAVGRTIDSHLVLPYVFMDKQTFERANLLARHKFTTLKLNESIQVLQEKREQATEQLESIQRYKDLSNESENYDYKFFGSNNDDLTVKKNQALRRLLSLGSCLHRLHVQFIMCLEIYQSYLNKIMKLTRQIEVSITGKFCLFFRPKFIEYSILSVLHLKS